MATLEVIKYGFIIICALVSPLDGGLTYIDGISFDPLEINPIMFDYVMAEKAFYFYLAEDQIYPIFKITQTDRVGLQYRYEIEENNESINIDLSELIDDFDFDYLKDNTIISKTLILKEQGEIEIYYIGNIVYLRTSAYEGMLFTVHD